VTDKGMSIHWLHCFGVDIKMTYSGSCQLVFCLCMKVMPVGGIVLSEMHVAHRTLHLFAVIHIYILYAVLRKYFVWSQQYLTHSSAY
jgi:hypothetical protein